MNAKLPDYALWETFKEQIKSDTFPALGELEGEEPFKSSHTLLKKYFSEIDDTSDFEDIYHIVTLLNSFHSTRMSSTRCYEVAKYIKGEKDFHKNILDKSSLEEDIIAKKEKSAQPKTDVIDAFLETAEGNPKTDKIQFSFMTKYCSLYSFYNSESKESLYPICDFLVLITLQEEQRNTVNDSNEDLASILEYYEIPKTISTVSGKNSFFEIMKAIRLELGVEYRKLDTFLWRRGKHIALTQKTKSTKNDGRYNRSDRSERSERSGYGRSDRSGRPERSGYDRSDRSERSGYGRSDRSERPERSSYDRSDRSERSGYNRSDRPERSSYDRSDRPERSGYGRSDRSERPERSGYNRSDRPERSGYNKSDRSDKYDRSDRSNRYDRSDRPNRNDRDDDDEKRIGKAWT